MKKLSSFAWVVAIAPSILRAEVTHGSEEVRTAEAASAPCPGYEPDVDPWSTNLRIEYGGKKRCLDMKLNRTAHILTNDEIAHELAAARKSGNQNKVELLAQTRPGETVVANVTCQGKTWLAVIPARRSTTRAVGQEEIFPTGLSPRIDAINELGGYVGHAQNRFVMAKKIKLVPQRRDDKGPPIEITNLISSDEAIVAPPDSYNPKDGQNGRYGLSRRLVCLEDKIEDMLIKQKHKVVQGTIKNQTQLKDPPRKIAPEDFPHELLMSALRLAEKDYQYSKKTGQPVLYKTFPINDEKEDSCITGFFDTYDNVVDYPAFNQPSQHLKRLPSGIFRHLYQRGLLDWNPLKREPTLAEEFKIKIK